MLTPHQPVSLQVYIHLLPSQHLLYELDNVVEEVRCRDGVVMRAIFKFPPNLLCSPTYRIQLPHV